MQPHSRALIVALLAVLGETVTDVLEPWPIKLVVDNVLQSKTPPKWLAGIVGRLFDGDPRAIL